MEGCNFHAASCMHLIWSLSFLLFATCTSIPLWLLCRLWPFHTLFSRLGNPGVSILTNQNCCRMPPEYLVQSHMCGSSIITDLSEFACYIFHVILPCCYYHPYCFSFFSFSFRKHRVAGWWNSSQAGCPAVLIINIILITTKDWCESAGT